MSSRFYKLPRVPRDGTGVVIRVLQLVAPLSFVGGARTERPGGDERGEIDRKQHRERKRQLEQASP